MKFKEALRIAIARGHVQCIDGAIFIPQDKLSSNIFPSFRNIKKCSLARAMRRAGFSCRKGVWFKREDVSTCFRPANSVQTECCHLLPPRELPVE